jgi:hypothetical protein
MIKTISAWKISSLNEYSVQIRLGSNLGGFFYFRKKEDAYGRKVDQMDPDEKIVEIAIERLRVLALELRNYMKIAHPGTFISKPVN